MLQPCVRRGCKPCLVCQEDMELERKIQELQERRRILRSQMNAIHDPFSFKFPPEIASHIFSLSMAEADYDPDCDTLRTLPTPFLLESVSRRWRQLARSTPQLWATISFTLLKRTRMNIHPLQFINDWLQLSGSLPLTLWITAAGGTKLPWEKYHAVIDSLNRHSGRWHKVSLQLDMHYFSLFCGISSPSNLYDLELLHTGRDIDKTPTPHFSMLSRPSPTRLSIHYYPLSAIDVAWRNIRHLALEAPIAFHECMDAIKQAPLLESFSVSEMYIGDDDNGPSQAQCISRLPRLRKLMISHTCGSRIGLIDMLELPSLEELQFELDNDMEVECLISLINRSGNRLKRLILRINYELKDLEKLLYRTPSLQKLECDFTCDYIKLVIGNLFQHLSSESSQPGFLPELDSLALSFCSGFFNWGYISVIYAWRHRKLSSLRVDTFAISMKDDDLTKIVALVDQGLDIRILENGKDYLEPFMTRIRRWKHS